MNIAKIIGYIAAGAGLVAICVATAWPIDVTKDAARSLEVLLVDSSDGVTEETGIAEGDVTVTIRKAGGDNTAYDVTGKWTEKGDGLYEIAFTAADLDTLGTFIYLVEATGCRRFPGRVNIVSGDLTAIKTRVDMLH